ncbi:MAG: FAD binding domain-containing protein [Treponema sp.]
METTECKVFYARNMTELFYHVKTIADLKIVGGCTDIERLPERSLSALLVPDLRQIILHERFIEFGAGTTLAEAEALGDRRLPAVLHQALKTIANPFVRNTATIGGNIFAGGVKHTLYAPLTALDASLEFKSQNETKTVLLRNFTRIPEKHVLTKIRVPLNDWDVALFYRLGHENYIKEDSASFAFLAGTEKSVVAHIRIALGGAVTFRCMELENRMIGLRLPLPKANIVSYLETAAASFDAHAKAPAPFLRRQFMNLVRHSLEQLM